MNKMPKEYYEADKFLSSLRLAHVEVRDLYPGEIDFIIKRANELKIPYVRECIEYIKNNRNIKKFKEV